MARSGSKRSRWSDAAPSSSSEEKKASTEEVDGGGTGGGGADAAEEVAEPKTKKKRRSRFSDAAAPPPPSSDTAAAAANGTAPETGTAGTAGTAATTAASSDVDSKKAKAAALQASISQRLAALKAKKAAGAAPPSAPAATAAAAAAEQQRPAKRARVYDIDLTDTTPLFKRQALEKKKQKKKINPYLAHFEQAAEDEDEAEAGKGGVAGSSMSASKESNLQKKSAGATAAAVGAAGTEDEILLDGRLTGGHVTKSRPRHRPLTFVEPGKYVALAEKKRERAANAMASGFVSGRKEGTYLKSGNMALIGMDGGAGAAGGGGAYGAGQAGLQMELSLGNMPPRADAPDYNDEASRRDNTMPGVMEWWDVELLPPSSSRKGDEGGRLRKEVAAREARDMVSKARGGLKKKSSKAAATAAGEDAEDATKEESVDAKNNDDDDNADRLALEERCYNAASTTNSKTHNLVQHPVPVKPPNAAAAAQAAKQPVLHLTKKEMKRQRKLRRAEKQREIQDMQAAGLVPPPEPRLTLSNFMRVLGDQAVMDPSQMEQKVNEQIQARKLKHERMNEERKLTKEQRKEKRARKLAEDTTRGVSVALFLVKDMSHRYHRTKVDLNAQQNSITGGVLECDNPKLALVIAEGGPKAIKRYTRLMTVRMKWRGENFLGDVESEDDEEEHGAGSGGGGGGEEGEDAPQKFNPNNSCELVWTGMGAKRMFNSFVFQKCESSDVARKVLEAKGVAHFWDQVLVHASGRGAEFNFKLVDIDGDVKMGMA